MSNQTQNAISAALLAQLNGLLTNGETAVDAALSQPPRRELGDLTTNLALRYAKKLGITPSDLAQQLANTLAEFPQVVNCQVVAPGFLNIYLAEKLHAETIKHIFEEGDAYGRGTTKSTKILVEYISSNPTGPLHIGHGRGAAYGATLVNLLRFSGCEVDAEYYVNDAGRQMKILALSVWLRGQQHDLRYPSCCYQGDYVSELAASLTLPPWQTDAAIARITENLPENPEEAVDECVLRAQQGIGEEAFHTMQETISNAMVEIIRNQLKRFKVHMNSWFSEASLVSNNKVQTCLKVLEDKGYLYTQQGALWFKSSQFEDEKDRVVRRSNSNHTYFATDIAYHYDKFQRGYDKLINIFGADHHGYIKRLRAALMALGEDANKLEFIINQFAVLWQGKEKLSLSTRAGVFVELDELFNLIGVDEARFMYLTQRHDQHLEFDLELTARNSRDNPVYYVNYAYARAGQICLQAEKAGLQFDVDQALQKLDQLTDERELALIEKLDEFPKLIQRAADQHSPHLLTNYARELAGLFHNYYAGVRVIEAQGPTQPRLALCVALRQVIRNCLALLNIQPPEHM